jgi:hypothetical protein
VLFEGGTWVLEPQPVAAVPLRRYDAPAGGGRGEQDWDDVDDGAGGQGAGSWSGGAGAPLRPDAALGTPCGLLLNELEASPAAVMAPLLKVLSCALELRNTSVYSPDAHFLVWLLETAVHVEAYLTHAAFE